jgi:hypothetical protein
MSGEPARVIDFPTPESVPLARFQAVSEALIDTQEKLDDRDDHIKKLRRELARTKGELKRLLAEYADDDEVVLFLTRWKESGGRSSRTDVSPTSDRADYYRRLRKRKRTRREIGLMVIGARNHHFPPFRKRDDMEDFAKSTKWAEECLELGLGLVGEKHERG